MNSILSCLLGTWFICSTNFPMWTKGHKTEPTFNYSVVDKKENVLFDEVRFIKKGRQKSIKGYDYFNANDSSFTWRGKGLLRVLKSHWKVVLMDPEKNWAVIYFTKTAFTPEGIDIISRKKDLSVESIESIKQEMLKDPLLKRHVPLLKNLYH